MRGSDKYWAEAAPDIVNNPELINLMLNAIRCAIWFWLKFRIYTADTGKGYRDVEDVTELVNGGYMGLREGRRRIN